MKNCSTIVPWTALATVLLLLSPSSTSAQVTYYWGANATQAASGTGATATTWSTTSNTFWNGSAAVNWSSVNSNIVGQSVLVNFLGSGTINRQFTVGFSSGTDNSIVHTLAFAANSTYSLIGTSANTNYIGNSNTTDQRSQLAFSVGSGALLNLGGGSNYQMGIQNSSNLSSGGLIFRGGGTINANHGTLIRAFNSASRLTILDGTAFNVGTGALFAGVGGVNLSATGVTSGSAVPNGTMNRIAVDNGTFQVNGGTVYAGYSSDSTSSISRSFGIGVGTGTTGTAEFTLTSGTVTALGDPRNTGHAYGGIVFGVRTDEGNASVGGTVNLNGGTLYTSNIVADPAVVNARLNLNGTNIIVSTAQAASTTNATATNAELQSRLDGFITGFAGTSTNRVSIGMGGAKFDTSQIDTTKTDGVATIVAGMEGAGGLTKIGANTLRLAGVNTYGGTTVIEGGSLEITGSITSDVVVNSGTTLNAFGQSFGDVLLHSGATINLNAGFFNAGDLTWTGGSTINLDLTNYSEQSGAYLSLGNLFRAGAGTVSLNIENANPTATYMLFGVANQIDFSAADIAVMVNGAPSLVVVEGNNIILAATAIPEPSSYALVAGVLTLGCLVLRRRMRSGR